MSAFWGSVILWGLALFFFLVLCAIGYRVPFGYDADEFDVDPAPSEPKVRSRNFPGNSHQRRLARRREARASKLGNA